MANFVINQTASEIQQILNKADTPDTLPTPNSQNLVESGGVQSYVDTRVNNIQVGNFDDSTLIESTETFPDSDNKIPTCGAVKGLITSRSLETLTVLYDNFSAPLANRMTVTPAPVLGYASSIEDSLVNSANGEITLTAGSYYYNLYEKIPMSSGGNPINDSYGLTTASGTYNGNHVSATASAYPDIVKILANRGTVLPYYGVGHTGLLTLDTTTTFWFGYRSTYERTSVPSISLTITKFS